MYYLTKERGGRRRKRGMVGERIWVQRRGGEDDGERALESGRKDDGGER